MTEFDPQELQLSPLRRHLHRLLPERHFMVRSSGAMRQFTLTSWHQMGVLAVVLLLFGWMTYATAAMVWMDDIVAAKNDKITAAREAYKSLLAEVSVYKARVADVTRALEANHTHFSRLVGSGGPSEAVVGSGVQPAAALGDDAVAAGFLSEQRRYNQEHQTLMAQLASLEQGMADLSQARLLLSEFDGIELEMRKVVLQRDLALSENKDLLNKVTDLESQLGQMENAQVMLVERFGQLAQDKIAGIEETLSDTGLDLGDLLRRKLSKPEAFGKGGPFLPLDLPPVADEGFDTSLAALNDNLDQLQTLRDLVLDLPLAGPLKASYRVTSRFGVRTDPFNGTAARHEGLDMGAPSGTPVHVTAPGKVVYAGWRGRYGRVIEVDHGLGLSTRYAHLSSIKVQLGQEVDRGAVIGTVGSSGRSTGPHLHYEVRVNGRPRNPASFMEAGKHVFEG